MRQSLRMERGTQVMGQSGHFLEALEQASAVAALDRPVLLVGERGTGKAMVAERMHRLSDRWDGPLVALAGSTATPDDLAPGSRSGPVRRAEGGTLVVGEVDALSAAAQLALLDLLEPAGRSVDVRIVATTAAHLPALAAEGRLRANLLDRLAFAVVTLPPLRERGGDALLLAHHHGRRMAAELGRDAWHGWGEEAEAQLTAHRWPGNLRELQAVAERSVAAWTRVDEPVDTVILDPFASPWQPSAPATEAVLVTAPPLEEPVTDLRAATDAFEARVVADALDRCRFNQRAAAKALGLTYDQLRHTARKHGLT